MEPYSENIKGRKRKEWGDLIVESLFLENETLPPELNFSFNSADWRANYTFAACVLFHLSNSVMQFL